MNSLGLAPISEHQGETIDETQLLLPVLLAVALAAIPASPSWGWMTCAEIERELDHIDQTLDPIAGTLQNFYAVYGTDANNWNNEEAWYHAALMSQWNWHQNRQEELEQEEWDNRNSEWT